MAIFSIANTKISGMAAAIPSNAVFNTDLKGLEKNQIDLLIKTIGINERRIAPSDMCASDLCQIAAEKLINDLNWDKKEIEILVFVTQTPDYIIPGTSMILQDKLGLGKTCLTIDINQGCAGYVYGLSVITSLISAGKMKKGLLLVGDTISKLIDTSDNSTVPIFSDAGTATAIEFDGSAKDFAFNLQTNGAGFDAIIVKEGGARNPQKNQNSSMKMQGHDIFTFALQEVVPNIIECLDESKKTKDEIDYFVLHQANKLLNESIRKKMDIAPDKVPYSLNKYGNTSCATIPLTIVSELSKEIVKKDVKLLLSGFGVGLSWGSVFVNISDIVCPELIEV